MKRLIASIIGITVICCTTVAFASPGRQEIVELSERLGTEWQGSATHLASGAEIELTLSFKGLNDAGDGKFVLMESGGDAEIRHPFVSGFHHRGGDTDAPLVPVQRESTKVAG